MSNLENLSQEDYNKAKQLFSQAIELDLEEIEEFITKECQGDKALQAAVASLVTMHQDSKGATINPKTPLSSLIEKDNKLHQGHKIGKFIIEKHIGSGGMGDVYLANRQDQEVQQKVAIKILKNKLNKSAFERFQIEKRVLAHLEHPGIARLIDAGIEDGLTFYAMEYIQGLDIDEYCKIHKLTIKQRLKLFIKVCEVVSYAHSNLIIHRDLKPKNILITAKGQVKLVDFGIAKPLQHLPGIDQLPQTMEGLFALTPQYAAPEQFKEGVIGTACDIYALGLLLYDLLTCTQAQDLSGLSLAEIEQTITKKIPPNPSRRIIQNKIDAMQFGLRNSTQLKNQLKGDLDSIINHAIKKEPENRYPSVAGFSQDIESYLQSKPILVRGNQLGYRLNKYLKRNWLPVSGLVALISVLSFSTYLISKEMDKAIQEKQIAQEVSNFLVATFKNADPTKSLGEKITAKEILAAGVRQIDSQTYDSNVKNNILLTMGEVYYELAEYDQSFALLDKIPISNNDISLLRAKVLNALGEKNKALTELTNYTYKENTESELIFLKIKSKILNSSNKSKQAKFLVKQMLDKAIKLYGDNSIHYAEYLMEFSSINNEVFDAPANVKNYEKIISIYKLNKITKDVKLARAHLKLGFKYVQINERQNAQQHFNLAYKVYKSIYGGNHLMIAKVLNNIGSLSSANKDFNLAKEQFNEAIAIKEKYFKKNDKRMATAYFNLGFVYLVEDINYTKASEHIEHAINILKPHKSEKLPQYNHFRRNFARVLIYRGLTYKAEKILNELEKYYKKKNYKVGLSLAKTRILLAEVKYQHHKYEESQELLNLALPILQKYLDSDEKIKKNAIKLEKKLEILKIKVREKVD